MLSRSHDNIALSMRIDGVIVVNFLYVIDYKSQGHLKSVRYTEVVSAVISFSLTPFQYSKDYFLVRVLIFKNLIKNNSNKENHIQINLSQTNYFSFT